MIEYKNKYFAGERILYGLTDAILDGITFGSGESPLKEAKNIRLKNSIFKWKYPLWYDENVKVENTTFETMSRSGIWYTKNISIKNSALQAPKLFRRTSHIILDNVHFANAEETMWTCNDIKITNSQINGDYFGKDSQNIYLDHVSLWEIMFLMVQKTLKFIIQLLSLKMLFGIAIMSRFTIQLLMVNI